MADFLIRKVGINKDPLPNGMGRGTLCVEGRMKRIPLITQGYEAIVDDEDHKNLSQHKWYRIKGGYAISRIEINGEEKFIYMHREIMKPSDGMEVDHINGKKLDNRRCNLRICERWQNNGNQKKRKGGSSKFKGVYRHTQTGKWCAYIHKKDKAYYLGCFVNEYEAASAYNEEAKKYFGEYAWLNEII